MVWSVNVYFTIKNKTQEWHYPYQIGLTDISWGWDPCNGSFEYLQINCVFIVMLINGNVSIWLIRLHKRIFNDIVWRIHQFKWWSHKKSFRLTQLNARKQCNKIDKPHNLGGRISSAQATSFGTLSSVIGTSTTAGTVQYRHWYNIRISSLIVNGNANWWAVRDSYLNPAIKGVRLRDGRGCNQRAPFISPNAVYFGCTTVRSIMPSRAVSLQFNIYQNHWQLRSLSAVTNSTVPRNVLPAGGVITSTADWKKISRPRTAWVIS